MGNWHLVALSEEESIRWLSENSYLATKTIFFQDESLNPFSAGDCGIFVSKIRKHGSADKAGLEVGDKLIQV